MIINFCRVNFFSIFHAGIIIMPMKLERLSSFWYIMCATILSCYYDTGIIYYIILYIHTVHNYVCALL